MAIVVERDVEHDIPEGFPVIRVDDTIPILSQLANAFYDLCALTPSFCRRNDLSLM